MKYDFCGYATKNDLLCADGRIIRRNAFAENDGQQVPLVWQHMHSDPANVLGHALLENRADGVYAYCSFNDTESGQQAKALVKHGDVKAMSIFANKLKQNGNDVVHGLIREVSLVLSGANPGALIDNISFAHSDGTYTESDSEAIIYMGENIDEEDNMAHSNETVEDVLSSMSEKQLDAVAYLMQSALGNQNGSLSHADPMPQPNADEETVGDIINTMNEKQKNVLYYLVGQAAEGNMAQSGLYEEGDDVMKHNVFDGSDTYMGEDTLSHDDLQAIFEEARDGRSLKSTFLAHGITNIDYLFPEAHTITPTPEMITREMGWVQKVWNATRKTPFSRIKSTAANLTENDARAKGYIKGNLKTEEQFALLKRVTTPQTVYKKQKLDRDDIIDITDIDVVAWLKAEMRLMLDEELARAILVGDGRSALSADKIKEENIRPIYQDADTYTIHYTFDDTGLTDPTDKSNALIDCALLARKDYKGSGNPTMYACTDIINTMLLAKDKIGRRLYATMNELADALRVKEIVEVPVLEGITRKDDDNQVHDLLFLIVNLNDYTVGADKGGQVNLFDDFDIDYNQEKYLIETRCSAALYKPYSAIAVEKDHANF